MEILTTSELMKLTRTELCSLELRFTMLLPTHPEASPERATISRNLRNIRRVIAWYDLAPE